MKKLRELLHSSILRTLSGGFLLVILPVMLLSLVSSYSAMRSMRNEMDQSNSSSTRLIAGQFSDKLLDLEMTAAPLFVDQEVVQLSASSAETPDLWSFAQFSERLKLNFNSRFISANVSAVFPAQRRVVSTRDGVERTERYSPGLDDLAGLSRDQPLWAVRSSLRHPSERCLSIVMGYVSPRQTRPLISIEIDEEEIAGQLRSLFQENDKVLSAFLLDAAGESVQFVRDGSVSQETMDGVVRMISVDAPSSPFSYSSGGHQYRVVFSRMEGYQLLIGIVFDEGEFLQPVTRMIFWLIGILVFALLAGVSYILVSYRRIYAPANNLVAAMNLVAEGHFEARAAGGGPDEFGRMARHFNSMVERLDRLLKEEYLTQVKLKKAQLRFLKSQINPHFLYNSLFGLYNMIKSGDLDDAAEMAIYLGQYYQMSAHFDEQGITVERELHNIGLYLQIHQMRAPGKLEYTVEVDPGLEEMVIPVLSLQTLVENAMSHAFGRSQEQNRLRICVRRLEGRRAFSVEDNGTGISEEELRVVEDWLETTEAADDTHGLQNVYYRLKLQYGDAVKLRVENCIPHGTRVTFSIPWEGEEKDV